MFRKPVLLMWLMMATAATEFTYFSLNRGVSYQNTPKKTFRNDDENIMEVLEREYERYEPPEIRRSIVHPSVEVGPGAFKSEIVHHPADGLKKQLNRLMQIKQKMEARNKDLNA